MSITVAAFYADIPGKPSRFQEYLPLALASQRALALTNPAARYVVLTDSLTAALFGPSGLECVVCAPEHMALMSKYIFAQREFLGRCDPADLIVLADVDCLANRALDGAIPASVGLATTHKGPKFRREINNLAYVQDRELGVRFLDAAYAILDGWPLERREWMGDQEAWQEVLGAPADWHDLGDEHFLAQTVAGPVDLYPCSTHNHPLADDGRFRPERHGPAYFVHLKGPRKQHLDKFMQQRFG